MVNCAELFDRLLFRKSKRETSDVKSLKSTSNLRSRHSTPASKVLTPTEKSPAPEAAAAKPAGKASTVVSREGGLSEETRDTFQVKPWVQRALNMGVQGLIEEFRVLAKWTPEGMTTEAFNANKDKNR